MGELAAAVEAVASIEAANPQVFDGIISNGGFWWGEVRGVPGVSAPGFLAADVKVFAQVAVVA